VAETRNELERAIELYADVTERWSDFGFILERAHALYGAGRCLLALNRGQDAVPKLEEARVLFGSLGASPLVAEVNGHLMEPQALTS
jgi:hypothetical protein